MTRRNVIIASLSLVTLLCGLCIAGAFMGADRAEEMFTSIPAWALWMLLLGATLAGLFMHSRPLHNPGSVLMHMGFVLLLAGAMWASPAGNRLQSQLTGRTKVAKGYMPVFQGDSADAICDLRTHKPLVRLPFALRLNRFDVDYYLPTGQAWRFYLSRDDSTKSPVDISCQPASPAAIPGSDVRLRVLSLSLNPSAWNPGVLLILPPGAKNRNRESVSLPAVVGAAVDVAGMALRVVRVFRSFDVSRGSPADAPDAGAFPAAQLEVRLPDGKVTPHFAFPKVPSVQTQPGRPPVAHDWGDGLTIIYDAAPSESITPSHGVALPAGRFRAIAEVSVCRGADSWTTWLNVPEHADFDGVSLEMLYATAGEYEAAGSPRLVLAGPPRQPSRYKADLSAMRGETELARKVVTANDPLWFGGYLFCQAGFDEKGCTYTVLKVRSDSGLHAVFIGMGLLTLGAMWRFWLAPLVGGFSRRRRP